MTVEQYISGKSDISTMPECFIFNNIKTNKTFFICFDCYDEIFKDVGFKKYFYERHIAGGVSHQECLNCSIEQARKSIA